MENKQWGFSSETYLSEVEKNLSYENISYGISLFGIEGELSTSLIVTGQEKSHREGDDGTHQIGLDYEYSTATINGDDVVIDKNTGLMWVRKRGDYNNGYTQNWYNAIEGCDNFVFAGYDDWRMPNVHEMMSIMVYSEDLFDFSFRKPLVKEPPFQDTWHGPYWTSTTYVPDTDQAVYVNLWVGVVKQRGKDNISYTIPVRGPWKARGLIVLLETHNKSH